MIETSHIEELSKLSISKLKERIRLIKEEIPEEKRKIITYSKNFTLSLSNYCSNFCKYCFYNYKVLVDTDKQNTTLLDKKEIKSLINDAIKYDCKEGLLLSGDNPESFLEVRTELQKLGFDRYINYVKDICDLLLKKNILPHINIGLLNTKQFKVLKDFTASMGLMLESTCADLFKKGGVHENSPGKLPERRKKHLINAGKLKIPFTTGILIGIGESLNDRISDLFLIKDIHEKYGHIQEVIIQNFEPKKGISYQPKRKILLEEFLKIAGIARVIFQNEISIQVPPNLIRGNEKMFIEMGINDFGGISPVTIDFINPKNKWPQIGFLTRICENIGYKLKERLPVYPKFINKSSFLSNKIKKVVNKYSLI